jgi:cell wall assembly regulator SMI1
MKSSLTTAQEDRKPSPTPQRPAITATFPEDLGISAVTSFMARQQQKDDEMVDLEREEDPLDDQPEYQPPSTNTTIVSQELPSVRFRLNLIRHKYATTTELTTLQLFRLFATAIKKTDKTMVFLPVDSTKQTLSPLSSQKQIDNLTPNQLRLYFSSYYKDQHHSISGFIHIVTSLTLEELSTQLPLAEWLQTYQYSIVLCKSQEEEMSLVGALCYGSLFLHRDSLLQGIMAHPNWIALNNKHGKPIVIDLMVKPFKCPGKSADMIFVRAERSKKEIVQAFFLELYDGTPKKYPRGDMLFFIPITSKLENDYTDEQRLKYLFNHSTFIGDEDCIAIHGLADLDNDVTLKDGSTITVRTLLKSLPASPGMSRSRLFQVVDPNGPKDCVLVTFQRTDKSFIEDRIFTLEKELLSHLAPGQSSQVLEDEFESLQYIPAYYKNKGKVIRVHHPTKSHQEFFKHADSIMSSPPKKRTHSAADSNQTRRSNSLQPLQVNNITYSGAVQAQTTRTKSVIQPDGTRTTTTTKMSQTVTASMEARFETIEREQQYMKQRITGVETRTATISDNIQAMMEHWKIAPAHYKRKPETELDDSVLEERDMEQANHSMSLIQGSGDKCF